MCELPIVRAEERKSKYTRIMNYIFNEKDLSLKAKGLLCDAISRPDNWKFSKKGIMYYCKDKENSIETALKELEEHFYLTREKKRDKGKFNTVYTFYEIPFNRNTNVEKPKRKKAEGDNPDGKIQYNKLLI